MSVLHEVTALSQNSSSVVTSGNDRQSQDLEQPLDFADFCNHFDFIADENTVILGESEPEDFRRN